MELSLADLRELLASAPRTHSFHVGTRVFVRAVTYHYVGRVVAITDNDVVLEQAAWVADSGRFANALATGELEEVEPYPDRVVLPLVAIVDWCEWAHELPREVR